MAGTGITVVVKSNRLPVYSAALRPALADEVSKAAFEIEARAKAVVPVKTGTLRRSIHTVTEAGGLTARVGPNTPYAAIIEFGGRSRPARPYMRPAAEAVLPRFVATVRALLAGLR